MNVAQIVINSLVTAGELGLIAIGLTMTFSVLRFANFAHTETAVTGAYVAFAVNTLLNANLGLSILVGALLSGLLGLLLYGGIFFVFRGRGEVAPMIASLGVAIALRNLNQAIFGAQIVRYDYEIEPGMRVLGGLITQPQVVILIVTLVAMALFHILLQHTMIGKAMRATAANSDLAQASGISTNFTIGAVWCIGSAFAGLGGALLAWDTQLDPLLGFSIVIPVFCCVLIGGVGSVYGAIAGALAVGFAQNVLVSVDFGELLKVVDVDWGDIFVPVAYKPAIVYLVVILILLFRPRGLARKEA